MCIPLLYRKYTGSSPGMAGDASRTALSKPATQCLEEVYTLSSFLLNSYAYIPNIYPSKHCPAYGFQLQPASCLPLPGCFGGLSKGPWMPKASDLLSSTTASYHSNTKGHSNKPAASLSKGNKRANKAISSFQNKPLFPVTRSTECHICTAQKCLLTWQLSSCGELGAKAKLSL